MAQNNRVCYLILEQSPIQSNSFQIKNENFHLSLLQQLFIAEVLIKLLHNIAINA